MDQRETTKFIKKVVEKMVMQFAENAMCLEYVLQEHTGSAMRRKLILLLNIDHWSFMPQNFDYVLELIIHNFLSIGSLYQFNLSKIIENKNSKNLFSQRQLETK